MLSFWTGHFLCSGPSSPRRAGCLTSEASGPSAALVGLESREPAAWADPCRRFRRTRTTAALMVALATLLTACSDDPARPAKPGGSSATSAEAVEPATTDSSAADGAADAVEEILEAYRGIYPGALVLLRVGDETRFLAGGRSELRTGDRITERHRFQIGSVTKTLVATVALQLVEDDELQLSDSVERWLPGLVPNGHRITVEHLLSHRSGLYNFTDSPRFEWTQEWIPNDLLALATTESPVHAPGTHSSYSNTNYVLLGLMVERVTGRHLATVVQQRVFDVAEMSDSSMTPGRVTESPRVHGYDGRRDVTLDDLSSIYGAGDAVSSARDLDAFVQALTAGRLLDATTFVQMTRSRGGLANRNNTDYGLGIARRNIRCAEVVGHGGGVPGFVTEAWATEDGERSVIAMVSDEGSGTVLDPVLVAALCG